MKALTAIIERNEEAFFAYVPDIDGCVAGGLSYEEVKINLEQMVQLAIQTDEEVSKKLAEGYQLYYEVDLESVFKLIPEVNITQLAKIIRMNPGLLRQYAAGTKKATEFQTKRVMNGIKTLSEKLQSLQIIPV